MAAKFIIVIIIIFIIIIVIVIMIGTSIEVIIHSHHICTGSCEMCSVFFKCIEVYILYLCIYLSKVCKK